MSCFPLGRSVCVPSQFLLLYGKPMFSCFLGNGLLTRGLLQSLCCQLWNSLWVCHTVSRVNAWNLAWGHCPALLKTGLGSGPGLTPFGVSVPPTDTGCCLCLACVSPQLCVCVSGQAGNMPEAIPTLPGTILFSLGSLTLGQGDQQRIH